MSGISLKANPNLEVSFIVHRSFIIFLLLLFYFLLFLTIILMKWGVVYSSPHPCWSSINKSETLEILMPNLVSLTGSIFQILKKPQTEVFSISGLLVKSLINKDCHNSRTGNNIKMKYEPMIKLEKRSMTTSRNLTMT